MIYTMNPFGAVNIGDLYTVSDPPKTQRISRRQDGYAYHPKLNDYDILNSIYDQTFFDLPCVNYRVQTEEAYRPDLIAYKVYHDTDFWSFLMLYNRLADPTEIVVGRIIKIIMWNDLSSWLTENIIQSPIQLPNY
jgi:hypothetical protein